MSEMFILMHETIENKTDADKVPLGSGTVFTTREEFEQRFRNLAEFASSDDAKTAIFKAMQLIEATRGSKAEYDWEFTRKSLLSSGFLLEPMVSFKARAGGTGDFVLNPNVPTSEWLVIPLDVAFVLAVRKAPVQTSAGLVKQLKCEIYPHQSDGDYHLGKAVASVRMHDGDVELGPCGPWPQHGVLDKAAGDAAMRLFHFPATW